MTYQLFDLVATSFYQIFGGGLIMPLLMIAVFALILLTIRGGKALVIIVLTPLVVVLSNAAASPYLQGMTVGFQWVPIVAFMGLGVLMAIAFWAILR